MAMANLEDRGEAAPRKGPYEIEAVLRDEAKEIHGVNFDENDNEATIYERLNALNSAAICLSGGGIRSAAFCLGVIQCLARHSASTEPQPAPEGSLLSKFHYLSTVSGGGYIGSWLSAWVHRAGYETVWRNLCDQQRRPGSEATEVSWLRSYSNYLTPRIGLFSLDAWAGIALFAYNLVLNWLVLIPVVLILVLSFKLIAILSVAMTYFLQQPWAAAISVLGVLLLIASLGFLARNRPSRQRFKNTADSQPAFLKKSLFLAVISAMALTQSFVTHAPFDLLLLQPSSEAYVLLQITAVGSLCGVAIYAASWIVSWPRRREWRDFLLWSFSGAPFGALVYFGFSLYELFAYGTEIFGSGTLPFALHLIFGVPLILASELVAIIIFFGLTSHESQSDFDQEWLGRAGGWLLLMATSWMAIAFLILLSGPMTPWLYKSFGAWVSAVGGISGILSWVIGRFGLAPPGEPKNKVQLSFKIILAVTAPIFAIVILIAISDLVDYFNSSALTGTMPVQTGPVQNGGTIAPNIKYEWLTRTFPYLLAILGTSLIAYLANRKININRISLHSLYRNRLARAFLGASNPRRNANAFTDFDPDDNVAVSALRNGVNGSTQTWRPFHIINIALNTISTRRLAWQERKAESFTVSSLYCGNTTKGFRDSAEYGSGISLATAMAISGAALSPNMGYQSTWAGSFVFSLLNVRLGWWLGNTGIEGNNTYRREAPKSAVIPLLQETFGLTSDDREYVYLSDGGHFDNLGLYEMVRRRCRQILVIDAGQDGSFLFEDLSNSARKIEIDLGVPIQFCGLEKLKPRGDKGSGSLIYHAMAEIDYPAIDGSSEKGLILYVKPAYLGTESVGIQGYANQNPQFPHEGTGQQWFGESQFESYRALGFEIMATVLASVSRKALDGPDLKCIFDDLWFELSPRPAAS